LPLPFLRSAPAIQQGDVQAAIGVAALKSNPIAFMKQVRIENHGTVGAVGNRDGPCIALGKEAAYRRLIVIVRRDVGIIHQPKT